MHKPSESTGAGQRAGGDTAPAKARSKHKIGTQGRKPTHRSTKAELNRENVTAQVIAALVSGKTFKEISEELGISEDTINRIKKKLPEEFTEYFATAKSNEITRLVEKGLKDQLEAMSKLVAVTKNEAWIEQQTAPEIATLFGVINDKTVRIFAAIELAEEREWQRRRELERERLERLNIREIGDGRRN